jgi:hypothetical protein
LGRQRPEEDEMSHQDWIKAPVPAIESADPCDLKYPTHEGPVEGNGSPVSKNDPAPVGSAEPHHSPPAGETKKR